MGSGNDPDAGEFDAFYLRSRDRLAVQVTALTGDPVEAVDHAQEAFVRAWTRWTYVGPPAGAGRSEPMSDDDDLEPEVQRLRVLERRTPVTAGWRAPDTVRRTAVLRRRRRALGAAAVLVVAAGTAMAVTTGGDGGRRPPQVAVPSGPVRTAGRIDGAVQLVADVAPSTSADPAAVASVSAAEQRLTFALLRHLPRGPNVSVSPASLYVALAMLQNGARGETARQIAAALQARGLDTAGQNVGLAGLTDSLRAGARRAEITLQSANSLWQQRGLDLRPAFLDALAAYYSAGVWQADFGSPSALAAINTWTARHTHGKIRKLFDGLDPSTMLVLADAVYFHAAWATAFDKNATEDGTFFRADGSTVRAKFMSGGAGLRAAATADYRAVELPYRGRRFSALAVMPTSGSLRSFVAGLTPARVGSIVSSLRPNVTVSVPRFTTTSTLNLVPALQALGMRDAFGSGADFSGLSSAALTVSQVVQRVYVGVGEKGTTAAAATGIAMDELSLAPAAPVRLDHPFLFLIRDDKTGAILFASEVGDPSAG